ncbi:MAG: esterase-like activity of phytase family protein [Kiloniellaceae bacterium]|nr:esterase-like activity of phytase family protein [Kiloniellaceae bacterium]
MNRRALVLAGLIALAPASQAVGMDIKLLTSDDPLANWRTVTYAGGKTTAFSIGLGSAAFRHPSDPANVIYVVSDRGPNFTCGAAKKIMGEASQALCKDVKGARFYPTPDYTPSIYRLELDPAAGTFAVKDVIALKTASGLAITGLLNPQSVAKTDQGLDAQGNKLAYDANTVDAEGLVKLSDGSFWIGEEMGPSVLHVAADGRILKRIVPSDAVDDYKAADTEIVGGLPAILSKRHANRGIESMAVSPDEQFLYFMLQNPLDNPDPKAYAQAKNTRLFKMERASGKLVGEYVYPLDEPQSFGLDPSDKQSAPRVSELAAIGPDRLLVLERTDATTKLHEVSLAGATNILGSKWDDTATAPSLELSNELAGTGIVTLAKTLRIDTARDFPEAPTKLEGIAFLGDGTLALINDNDFGIGGDETKVLLVGGAVTVDTAIYTN